MNHAGKFGFIKGVDKGLITTRERFEKLSHVESASIRQRHISLNFKCDDE